MLQATYKSAYIFYVSTEDKRYDTSVPTSQLRYLFKFTNDMDKRVAYAYGQSQVVYNRYTKVTFSHDTSEDIFTGKVNFVPNGYWYYKVYEVSATTSISTLNCSTVPQSAEGKTDNGKDDGNIGKYTLTKPDGTVTTTNFTGKNDVNGLDLSDLDAGTYYIKIYNGCGNLLVTDGFTIDSFTAQTDDTRWLEVTTVAQTDAGTTYTVKSNAPIGYSYDFGYGGGYVDVTNITSKPQTNTFTFAQNGVPSDAANLRELVLYDQTGGNAGGGTKVWGVGKKINLFPISNPSSYYGTAVALVDRPVSVNSGGTVLSKGSAVISVINGATADSTTQGYYTLQGIVEQGKLYVSEESGQEQVQYTEYTEPSGTNYIYYGQ